MGRSTRSRRGLRWASPSTEPRSADGPADRRCPRSVNGKHTPFVRPRCGFDSCRGLLSRPKLSGQSAVLRRRRPLVRVRPRTRSVWRSRTSGGVWGNREVPPAGSTHADVAQPAEHRSATPGRPVRSGPSASQARGVTGAHRAPTSTVRVRILAGLLYRDRCGPRWPGYLVKAETPPSGFDTRPYDNVRFRSTSHDRDDTALNHLVEEPPGSPRDPLRLGRTALRAGRHGPVIDYSSTGRGFESRPEHSVLR
jgi:hypothetical protein